MREIKFRAWDKSDKVMLYEGIDYPTENLNYTYSFFKKQLVLRLQGENSIGEQQVMCTVEIGPFGTNLQEWTFKEEGYLPEVIGNIYENPELLK